MRLATVIDGYAVEVNYDSDNQTENKILIYLSKPSSHLQLFFLARHGNNFVIERSLIRDPAQKNVLSSDYLKMKK